MKKIYTSLFLLAVGLLQQTFSQTGSVNLIPPNGIGTAYSSIGTAYAAISTPLTGNYLIEFTPSYSGAAESYPIQLTDKGLTPGGNTITIRPAAGNSNSIIQRTTAAAGAVIQFNGADNVILDGRPGGITSNSTFYLTVNDSYSGDNTSRNIEFLNGANNNIVRYLNSFAADVVASGAGSRNIFIGPGSTAAGGNNSNTITNCIVNGGQRGIQDSGLSAAVPNSGNIISNDSVRRFGVYGIIANYNQSNITIQNNLILLNAYAPAITGTPISIAGIRQQSLASGTSNILNNTIQMNSLSSYVSRIDAISDVGTGVENIIGNRILTVSIPATASAPFNYLVGISLNTITGASVATINVRQNKISGLSTSGPANIRGIEVFPATGSTININNNFVAITDTNANAVVIYGIVLANPNVAYTTNQYFNSVRIGGVQTSANTASAYGILRASNSNSSIFNQRNNIVINERTGGSATSGAFYGFVMSNVGTNAVNYNTYYATDAVRGYAAGGWDGSYYQNNALATYKTSAGTQEQNSNFATATFVSATDLHLAPPSSTATTLYGTPVMGITTDIDNGNRSTTNPYQGADEPGVAAPVQLLSFSGEGRGDYNTLRWQTATEQNSKGFYLERSAGGREFTSLVFVPSKAMNGNSSAELSYGYDDVKPLSSKGFYRLRQTDLDGKETLSGVIAIAGKTPVSISITSVYPNPVVASLNLIVKTPADARATLTVVDATGKIVVRQNAALKTGDNYLSVSTAALSAGMYTLSVKDAVTNEAVIVRFVK